MIFFWAQILIRGHSSIFRQFQFEFYFISQMAGSRAIFLTLIHFYGFPDFLNIKRIYLQEVPWFFDMYVL